MLTNNNPKDMGNLTKNIIKNEEISFINRDIGT